MWYRKIEDKERLKKLSENIGDGYPQPVYYDKDKGRYVRLWKSEGKRSNYAYFKRRCRKDIRRRAKSLGYYHKKLSELWWKVY